MNSSCLKESLAYYATISCNDNNYKTEIYKRSCRTSFKKRYSNHKKLFNAPLYKYDTKLSTEYWNLKIKQLNPQISWKIKGIYKSSNRNSKRCYPSITEKLELVKTCWIKDQKSSPSISFFFWVDYSKNIFKCSESSAVFYSPIKYLNVIKDSCPMKSIKLLWFFTDSIQYVNNECWKITEIHFCQMLRNFVQASFGGCGLSLIALKKTQYIW